MKDTVYSLDERTDLGSEIGSVLEFNNCKLDADWIATRLLLIAAVAVITSTNIGVSMSIKIISEKDRRQNQGLAVSQQHHC